MIYEPSCKSIYITISFTSSLCKKTGKRFYVYEGEKQKGVHQHVIDQLNQIVKPAKHRATEKDIIDRCVLLQVNEAAYELGEGIVQKQHNQVLARATGTGL